MSAITLAPSIKNKRPKALGRSAGPQDTRGYSKWLRSRSCPPRSRRFSFSPRVCCSATCS